jgi:hypothetical protein
MPIMLQKLRNASLLVTLLLVSSAPAEADEGGAAFWLSGQYASMSAVPPAPGWSLTTLANVYRGTEGVMRMAPSLDADVSTELAVLLLQPGYAFATKVLGGTPYLSIAGGLGVTTTKLDTATPSRNLDRSQTISGGPDLNPFASLSWDEGVNNFMTYLSVNVPVGSYNPDRIANLGIGHAAIDLGAAYTYLDPDNGWEFSALAGLTYNWENPYTDYQNGIDSHLDWGASRWVNKNWELGVAGYAYYQLTDDSGAGDDVGGNRSRIAAIGPAIGYQQQWKTASLYVALRGYQEFWAANRPEGQSVFLEASYSWLEH